MYVHEYMENLINALGEVVALEKAKFIVRGVTDGLIFYGHNNWSNYKRSDTEVCVINLKRSVENLEQRQLSSL